MKIVTFGAKIRVAAYLAVALYSASAVAQAQTTQKYFGYYAADYPIDFNISPMGSGLPEMKDHINLYSIMDWSGDESPSGRAATEAYVLDQLAKAKAAHTHAIISAFPFLFKPSSAGGTGQAYDPTGAQVWSDLAQKMVAQGYLIPGNPAMSTVVAVYVVDEPNSDTNYLWDVNGAARPDLVSITNVIRQTPETAKLPLATVVTNHFKGFEKGMQLFDWIGFDHYGDSDSEWASSFNKLKSLAPGKKYIVVPGAMDQCSDVAVEPTNRYFAAIENDASVTWLAPFAWFSRLGGSEKCKGVRDLPSIRASYTSEGLNIRSRQCNASVGDKKFCAGTPQPDMYIIAPNNTGSGQTEVHVLDSATAYSSFKLHAATALGQYNPDQVAFAIGDANNDGKTDIYFISRYGNGTPNVEVHILDGASNYASFIGHYSTSLAALPGGLSWTFDVGDYNQDGTLDLYAFKKVEGGSAKTELHIYSGSDGFQTALAHLVLPLGPTGDDDAWEFHVADIDSDGIPDVVAVAKQNGISTEVHILKGSDNYSKFSLETGTALSLTGKDSRWVFGVNDYNNDGQADLFAINKVGQHGLEVHVLKGNEFRDYLLHAATVMGALPTDSSKTVLINR
jgi:hypothetical protein